MVTAQAGVLRTHLARLNQTDAPAGVRMPAPAAPRIEQIAANAIGRAGEAVAGLAVLCENIEASMCSLAELPELLPEHALLAMIEADQDRLGVMALSPGMMTALIEMQAFGRVGHGPEEARRPTRADAVLASDFINLMLASLGADATRLPDENALVGFRYASHLQDARPLGLMLDDRGYRTLRWQLRLGHDGSRGGTIFLAAPSITTEQMVTGPNPINLLEKPAGTTLHDATFSDTFASPPQTTQGKPAAPIADRPHATPRKTLALAMQQAPVSLVAVLCRRKVTLAELRGLTAGSMLALPRQALAETRVETAEGRFLASGKLGEAEGFHAVRLHDPDITGTHARPAGTSDIRVLPEPPMDDLSQPDDFRNVPPQPASTDPVPEQPQVPAGAQMTGYQPAG